MRKPKVLYDFMEITGQLIRFYIGDDPYPVGICQRKVNNKVDNNCFALCSSVSVVNFEHVIADWVI